MAFGESWGIVRDFTDGVKSTNARSGPLDEAIFNTKMPELAASTVALLDVSQDISY